MRRPLVISLIALTVTAGLAEGWAPAMVGSAVAASAGSSIVTATQSTEDAAGPAVPGELIVEFEPGTRGSAKAAVHARLGARLRDRIARGRFDVVRLPPGVSVAQAVRRYRADPTVRHAEPNLLRLPAGAVCPNPEHPEHPDDLRFCEQWALYNVGQDRPKGDGTVRGTPGADISAPDAWREATGVYVENGDTKHVVVAVIDTGVLSTHEDLANQLTPGYDFQNDDPSPEPGNTKAASHGTHVAGIVAAERNNAKGIAGVCPDCRIMPLRFGLDLASSLQAIHFAIDNGAKVINASYTGIAYSTLEWRAIRRANRRGVVFVAAAGNSQGNNDMWWIDFDGTRSPQFPASYLLPNVISVAASNHHDRLAVFTNVGRRSVHVAAPGVDILSTVTPAFSGTGYALATGTSMSAPHVAGVAGLLLSRKPHLTPRRVRNAIMNGADRRASLREFRVTRGLNRGTHRGRFVAAGRLNAADALTAPAWKNATPRTDDNIDGARFLRRVQQARLAWPNDVNDVYRRRLKRGQRIELRLTGPAGKDYDLFVWRPGTRQIWQLTGGCYGLGGVCPIVRRSVGDTADERIRFRVRRNGVYYVHVTSYFSTGRYTLRFRRL